CTGFSPQKWMWPNQTSRSEGSITNALPGCQAGKPLKIGTFPLSWRAARGAESPVYDSPDHQKALLPDHWFDQFLSERRAHPEFWIPGISKAVRNWHLADT